MKQPSNFVIMAACLTDKVALYRINHQTGALTLLVQEKADFAKEDPCLVTIFSLITYLVEYLQIIP